jgi:hypothetical protein
LLPSSAIIGKGGVFFPPVELARRSMMSGGEWFIHPDLAGMDAAAFTAAAMLYRVFAALPPFHEADEVLLRQDMREGNFVPVRLEVPALDGKLALLIQGTLSPAAKDGLKVAGKEALQDFLACLQPDSITVSAASFMQPVSAADILSAKKEKAQYVKVKTASVKTRRFVKRNTALLLGVCAAAVAAILIVFSISSSRSMLPTTAGMDPVQVIESYYNAFGELDHQLMEACVTGKAGKDDIGMVANLFVINKVRQAYEFNSPPLLISAAEWLEGGGGPVESGVFGVTDLLFSGNREQVTGNKAEVSYLVDYTLWLPAQFAAEPEPDTGQNILPDTESFLPLPYRHSVIVTLVQQKGNWRISQIKR